LVLLHLGFADLFLEAVGVLFVQVFQGLL
jgi:hypothetical protein